MAGNTIIQHNRHLRFTSTYGCPNIQLGNNRFSNEIKTIVIGAFLGATVFATQAMAEVYECKVRSNGRFGGIAPLIIFSINEDENAVFVYDGLIKEIYDKPIMGAISVANAKRYTFKWSVDTVSTSDGEAMPRIDYRATFLKATHRFTVTGFPAGWDNQFNGTGTCKRTK